jgi:magnesium transporter
MLNAFPIASDIGKSLTDACWIDLVDPTPTEAAAFEKSFGLQVPTKEELSEIETTSRLKFDHGALYMTVPLILATGDEPWIAAPTGFVLSKTILLTVRFLQTFGIYSGLRSRSRRVG